jgi:dihydrofolate synthase/folylpolyglutamate synthase
LLEVGLGGRLDAVNVFDADLVLLPSISRDHQEILGRRYDQILSEKLGTLRRKTKLIHFLDNQYLIERAQTIATNVGAEVVALRDIEALPAFEFSLRNHVLAASAYCWLEERPFLPGTWGPPEAKLENRGEFIRGESHWLFFGSHNVDGLRKLIQFLQRGTYNFGRPPYDAVIVAFSKRNPEDLRVMLKMLKRANLGDLVVTTFDHPKAAGAWEMEVLAREEGSEFVHDIDAYVQGRNKGQSILVTGSYYFLGHVKSLACCR